MCSVRKATEAKSWRAISLLADGGVEIAPVIASASSHSLIALVDSLMSHIETLQTQRKCSQTDLDESMNVMKRWRSREQVQRNKQEELKGALDTETATVVYLENENRNLKCDLEMKTAEIESLQQVFASHSLYTSVCLVKHSGSFSSNRGGSAAVTDSILNCDNEPSKIRSPSHASESFLSYESEPARSISTESSPRTMNTEFWNNDTASATTSTFELPSKHAVTPKHNSCCSSTYDEEEKDNDSVYLAVQIRMRRIKNATRDHSAQEKGLPSSFTERGSVLIF